MRYLINLSYNGSKFYGYQVQDKFTTVEKELEKTLSTIFNQNINTKASSRTDRFVHAYDQYCVFDIEKDIDTMQLINSLNRMINEYIHIKSISKVNDEFNIRYDVKEKEYIYKINMGKYNPIEKEYVYQYNKKIDIDVLKSFINKMNGKHNFRSFTSDNDKENYERDITITYEIIDDILYLKFISSGFLRYMIRNIVGLLLDINDSKVSVNDIDNIFKAKDRQTLGKPACGCGLYLNRITFNKNNCIY